MKNQVNNQAQFTITQTIELIKDQVGIDLVLCDCFPGVKYCGVKPYFNIMFKERIILSQEYKLLESFAKRTGLIEIQPNGVNRAAVYPVFLKNKETTTLINDNGEHFETASLNILILSKLNSNALKFIEDNTNLKFKSDGCGNLEAFPESNNQLAILLTMYSWKTQRANDFILLKICSHEEFYNN